MTTAIALIGPNLRDQSKGIFHVHTATCRDGLNSRKYPLSERHELEVDSRFDVLSFIYDDHAGDNGFSAGTPEYNQYIWECSSDFYFHNCVSDLSAQTPEISEEPVPSPEPLINVLRDHEEVVAWLTECDGVEETPQEVVKLLGELEVLHRLLVKETPQEVVKLPEETPQEVVKLPEESVQDFIERVASTVTKPEETLQCRQCGSCFTRTIVRGRKPHRCPTCRGGK